MADDPARRSGIEGWIVPGIALAVAALVVAVALATSTSPTPSPQPSTRASAARDDHLVVSEGRTFRIGSDAGAITISEIRGDGGATKLARSAAFGAAPSEGATAAPTGTAIFALVCDPGATNELRILFGRLDPGPEAKFSGAIADGQQASDGLFVFVLRPGPLDPRDRLRVDVGSASGGMTGKAFLNAATAGTRQPSGCFVNG